MSAPGHHWHTGMNEPGCLPEVEPGAYPGFDEAKEALAEDIEYYADAAASWADPHDCDDVPCPSYGDSCPWQAAGDLRVEREALLASRGPEWWGFAVGQEYWVRPCDEPDCLA